MNPGVITGVFSCAKVRNEKLEVRSEKRKRTEKRDWKKLKD
jgi:hypothetical protein